MVNNKSYISYLPQYLQQVLELNELGNLVDKPLLEVSDNENHILEEMYVETAVDYGLERLEKILNITNKANDAEIRRKEILTKYCGERPYTFKSVYEKLISICGAGNVYMEYGDEPYTLIVKVGVRGAEYINIVEKYLKQVVPANIFVDCSIAYNTHSVVGNFTHEYLHSFKHKRIKEGVIE